MDKHQLVLEKYRWQMQQRKQPPYLCLQDPLVAPGGVSGGREGEVKHQYGNCVTSKSGMFRSTSKQDTSFVLQGEERYLLRPGLAQLQVAALPPSPAHHMPDPVRIRTARTRDNLTRRAQHPPWPCEDEFSKTM
jgi:hypothetical protein